ncbi:MAG: BREX system P-loop protein BrxC [bacterium]
MINRDIYLNDPKTKKIKNEGYVVVKDNLSLEEQDTLRYELDTFVCKGEYERGLQRILETFRNNVYDSEQPGVWVSGFYGSGKSHLVKMLKTLWTDYTFPDKATARGLAKLPDTIKDLLKEISSLGQREGGLHAASGTLRSGENDHVRLTLLGIIFKSVGLAEQYPVACFEIWLKEHGFFEMVKSAVENEGKDWQYELANLYASPLIAKALLNVYPDFAENIYKARELLKAQFSKVTDVSNDQMKVGIERALKSTYGSFPLTLIVLDEVQQFIETSLDRSMAIQEMVETCSKAFGGKLMFVGTGQTAMAGTSLHTRLKGRFPISIELSDTEVNQVIRQVILQKKPVHKPQIKAIMNENIGEISRHLSGTKIEHIHEDTEVFVEDYPILPVRRRFWEKALQALDQGGTAGQLRNQLRIVHEAVCATADQPLGTVIGGDFIFDQIVTNLLQTGLLAREIYEYIQKLKKDGPNGVLKARLCALIYIIGKLPKEAGFDLGIQATPDTLADLMIENLSAGSVELRKTLPKLLSEMETDGKIMLVGNEYKVQTREFTAWNDEYRSQINRFLDMPQRVAQERTDLLRKECGDRLKGIRLVQGKSKTPRSIKLHFGLEKPSDIDKQIYVWIRDGWDENESSIIAEARAAGMGSPAIFVFLPKKNSDEMRNTIAALYAATATLDIRKSTVGSKNHETEKKSASEEAQNAMETKRRDAENRINQLIAEIFKSVRVFQGGGNEIISEDFADAVRQAADSSMIRLYPNFDSADHTGWGKVITLAKKGSEAALEAVDYQGDIDKHPVTADILQFTSVVQKGADIRKNFDEAPYGWPKDSVDGAIYTLMVSGHLRALDPVIKKAISLDDLDRAKIGQAHFRIVDKPLTATQRVQIRKLLQHMGEPCQAGSEEKAVLTLIEKMKKLAETAGGDPPRPVRPDIGNLNKLEALSGNEMLTAIHAQQDHLKKQFDTWTGLAKKITERMIRWKNLETLLSYAANLKEIPDILKQVDAIIENRSLLMEPNPIPELCSSLTQILRVKLTSLHALYQKTYDAEFEKLKQDENWQKLTPENKHELLLSQKLTVIPVVRTGTEDEVLGSLRNMNLSTWDDRIAALPERFRKAREAAAEEVDMAVEYIDLPDHIFKTEDDIDRWIQTVKALIMKKLDETGGPVRIG